MLVYVAPRLQDFRQFCHVRNISRTATLFSLPYLTFIHPKMMGKFVPNGFRYHLGDRQAVFLGSILDGNLIQGNGIRHRHTDAVLASARGEWNAFVESEKCLVIP